MAGSKVRAGVALAASALPGSAFAHGALPGSSGFAAGFAHPFQATEQVLALIALGLFLGASDRRLPLAMIAAGFVLGLVARGVAPPDPAIRALTLVLGVAIGLTVALAPDLPHRMALPVALAAGASVGTVVGAGTDFSLAGLALSDSLPPLFGAGAAAVLIVLNAVAFARCRIGRGPGRRIGASWIAAASVMLLAFYLGAAQVIA